MATSCHQFGSKRQRQSTLDLIPFVTEFHEFSHFFSLLKLISQKAVCPKYDEMLSKMYSDPPEDLRQFVESNADLFAYISKHTGGVNKRL